MGTEITISRRGRHFFCHTGRSDGGRQGADRQVYDSFACPHIGAGKTFNRLCVNMLSAAAHVARCHLSVRPVPQLRLRHPPLPGVSLIGRIRCHLSVRPVPQLRLRHPPLPGVSLIGRIRCHLSVRPAPQLRLRHPPAPGVSRFCRNRCYLHGSLSERDLLSN